MFDVECNYNLEIWGIFVFIKTSEFFVGVDTKLGEIRKMLSAMLRTDVWLHLHYTLGVRKKSV